MTFNQIVESALIIDQAVTAAAKQTNLKGIHDWQTNQSTFHGITIYHRKQSRKKGDKISKEL